MQNYLPEVVLWRLANRMSVSGAIPSTDICIWLVLTPGGYQSGRQGPEATADWNSPTVWRLRTEGLNRWTVWCVMWPQWLNNVCAGYPLADMDMRAWMGLQAIMQTIMMGKMEIVLPDMYMMKRFIGICFRGPRATSQQRCSIEIFKSDCHDSSKLKREIHLGLTVLAAYLLHQVLISLLDAGVRHRLLWVTNGINDISLTALAFASTPAAQRQLRFHFPRSTLYQEALLSVMSTVWTTGACFQHTIISIMTS